MDSNTGNRGAVPPPETTTEVGQPTQYFPPQGETNSQGYTTGATQDDELSAYAPPSSNGVPPYTPLNQQGQVYGQPQQQYPQNQQYQQYRPNTARSDRDRTMWALILIGGGLLLLLAQFDFFDFPGFGDLVLLVIGGAFMYAYANTRPGPRIGFLIPGAILLGLGVGQVLMHLPFVGGLVNDDITPLTLGLGFCLIWALERKHWWALIPGGILVMVGLTALAWNLWPLALIALGVYLLYEQSHKKPAR